LTTDTSGAIAVLRKALVNDTDRADAAHNGTVKLLSDMLRLTKQYRESAEVFQELVKKTPTMENLNALAYIYAQGGMEAQALEVYNQMLAKDPNSLAALKGIGDMYAKEPANPKMRDAFERLSTAAQQAGNKDLQGQAEFWVGYYYYTVKEFSTAIPRLNKATTLLPTDSPYFTNLALVLAVSYQQEKDKTNAIKWYKEVLKRDHVLSGFGYRIRTGRPERICFPYGKLIFPDLTVHLRRAADVHKRINDGVSNCIEKICGTNHVRLQRVGRGIKADSDV
jgi:tetratricopeptide (TPR) repeat protein